MKANEFVKKYGWGWAKEVVENQPEIDAQIFNPYNQKYSSSYTIKRGVSVAHLKLLIEAKELVDSKGGISRARKEANCLFSNDFDGAAFRIFEAIQLVESVENE